MESGSGELRLGKFSVVRRLGRGGMGAVYEGHDPALDRRVAIKTLTTDVIADTESRNRFEREARAAAKLQHPNIVTIYELGNFGRREKPYIVMEYLEGTDVQMLIGDTGLAFDEALEITIQLCRALDFAHQHGVVHRDVKPANLRYLDNGQIKIMDFGIARVEGSAQITKSGVMVGTLHYMSPEQIQGKQVDGRSDIFSAGCILYEMLAGKRPFPGESATAILYRIVNEEPSPVTAERKDLPQEIQTLLDRALAKNPEARFESAGAMAQELSKLLEVYRKTLPRTPPAVETRLQELQAMSRDQRWSEIVPAAKKLLETYPRVDVARRLLRRALRELQSEQENQNLTPEEKTRDYDEISAELALLYGPAGWQATRPAADLPLGSSTGPAVSEEKTGTGLRSWAWVLAILILGILGFFGWKNLSPPPIPKPIVHPLVVRSEPVGATVWVNGTDTGLRTGEDGVALSISGMPSDRLVIELRRNGFRSASADVIIGEQAPEPISLTLVALSRSFKLVTEPGGATVRLDGEALPRTTPLDIELGVETAHELLVEKVDYQSRRLSIAPDAPLPDGPLVLTRLSRPGRLEVASSYPLAILSGSETVSAAAPNPSATLRAGRHQITLLAPAVFLRRTVEIDIVEGETTPLTAPSLGRVAVRAIPGNCTVTINGFQAEPPPIPRLDVVVGEHQFVFAWPNGEKDVQTIRVESGKPAYVSGQMIHR